MVFGLFSGRGLQGLVYTLFGTLVLSTLWVTSLTVLSTPAAANDLLTQAGTQVLNPFLVNHQLGLTKSTYATLEASARAHPDRFLSISVLNVKVKGREILGHPYGDTVHLVFSRVATTYYNGGASAAFSIPSALKQELPNFALFNPDNIQVIPGGPTVAQLPPFVQPLFIFTGLTPATFTASGHQRLVGLLPWFWGVTIVLGLLAVVLNRSDQKLSGLAKGIIHGAWPVVAVLLGAWVVAHVATSTFAPYAGILDDIRGAFLPVYGAALAIGLVSLGLLVWVPKLQSAKPSGQTAEPPGTSAQLSPVAGPVPAGESDRLETTDPISHNLDASADTAAR